MKKSIATFLVFALLSSVSGAALANPGRGHVRTTETTTTEISSSSTETTVEERLIGGQNDILQERDVTTTTTQTVLVTETTTIRYAGRSHVVKETSVETTEEVLENSVEVTTSDWGPAQNVPSGKK